MLSSSAAFVLQSGLAETYDALWGCMVRRMCTHARLSAACTPDDLRADIHNNEQARGKEVGRIGIAPTECALPKDRFAQPLLPPKTNAQVDSSKLLENSLEQSVYQLPHAKTSMLESHVHLGS